MTDRPPPNVPPPPPGVRTTRRRGRTSDANLAALRDLGPRWGVPGRPPWSAEDLATAFGFAGPLLVDIGVGDGRATLAWAEDHPRWQVLALELHRPSLAKLLVQLEAGAAPNVRVLERDAIELVSHLEPETVGAIRILFPDPWPKRRHVARRLVDRAFVRAVADALAPAGRLELATDWADYADHMQTMVATDPRLEPAGDGAGSPRTRRPDRPITAYEQLGLDAGRSIVDLAYRRAGAPHR